MDCYKGWFQNHNWGKWEVEAKGPLINRFSEELKSEVGFWVRQKRHCLDCNLLEVAIQKARI